MSSSAGSINLPTMNPTPSSNTPVVELHVYRREPVDYAYEVRHAGEVLFDGNTFTSVAETLRSAAEDCMDFTGLQVGFEGIVVGTYTPTELQAAHEAVAALCVDRRAVFSGHVSP
jgi:hypothetical protein